MLIIKCNGLLRLYPDTPAASSVNEVTTTVTTLFFSALLYKKMCEKGEGRGDKLGETRAPKSKIAGDDEAVK